MIRTLACLLSFSLLIPDCSMLQAQETSPAAKSVSRASKVADVALQQGQLLGRVVDSDGNLQQDKKIELVQSGKTLQSTQTNQEGAFALGELSPGVYQLRCENRTSVVRVWDARVACPAARPAVLLVVGDTLRSQCYDSMDYAILATSVVGVGLGIAALIDDGGQVIVSP
ncbi:MAG: carboxypeptidase regulatory-like domain-containing protein [Planctomycetaceae bacterium]|nr:carboxypeptidase regulatory-like domain-containing protein [Planctomycetaceae bacterium]